jgi:hypothetical protein
LNVLVHARSHDSWEPADARRYIPTTLETWRDDRTRIEEALRYSDNELRTICGAIHERTISSPPPEPNVHGKIPAQGVQELAEVPRQIAMLEVWQARRDRLAEALRRSNDDLVAVFKKACRSGVDVTLRVA